MATPASPDCRKKDYCWTTKNRLEKCWSLDVNWDLYPLDLKEVRIVLHVIIIHIIYN